MSFSPHPLPRFIQRDNLWVAVLIILSGLILCGVYYRVDMDIVLLVQLLSWALIIPEIVSCIRFPEDFSPSAKINLSSSCYVNNWNAIIYILHEFLANRSNFFAECGGEHHDLLAMWCASEDFLNVFTHVCWDEREEKRLIVSGMFSK
jgi:hypothetical protein